MNDIQRQKIGGSIRRSGPINGSVVSDGMVDGSVGKAESASSNELIFKNRFEFPTIGNLNLLYIATDENQIYRWDSDTNAYICTGADWHDIEIIDGGNSNGK